MSHQRYRPSALPADTPPALKAWLADEFRRVSVALQHTHHLEILTEEPRAEDGEIVYADGTSWDPGSGEGFYGRENGAWVKL